MKGVARWSVAFDSMVAGPSILEVGALAYERDDGGGKSVRLALCF